VYDSLSIIIPVYNEAENIAGTLAEIETEVGTPHQIFIIYDFEEDNTLNVVRGFMQEKGNIHIVKNRYGKGALNAIRTGFETVDDGIVLVVMADLSDDLGTADEMVQKINEGYDIVCGSRYMKGGKQIGGTKLKGFLSRMAGISLHFLTGIPTHDITNSFKMYTKRVLENIKIESNGGFELGMEIVVKAYILGYKIKETPSVWRDRNVGQSRFRLWKWLPKYMHWYLYAIKNSLFAKKQNIIMCENKNE